MSLVLEQVQDILWEADLNIFVEEYVVAHFDTLELLDFSAN